MYNIVTTPQIIQHIKKSKYFKIKLGYSLTLYNEKKSKNEFNENNKFGIFYKEKKKSICQKEGNIGPIDFYSDYYINKQIVSVWIDSKEYEFDFNFNITNIDDYIGKILNDAKVKNEKSENNKEIEKILSAKPDPNKIINNPGAVTYEDLKEYYKNKNKI